MDKITYPNFEEHKEEKKKKGLTVESTEHGKNQVNVFLGRFQPVTLGHLKVIDEMYKENGLKTVVFIVKPKTEVIDESRPFTAKKQLQLLKEVKKTNEKIADIVILEGGAAIDRMFNAARPKYEPVLWGTGTDRKKAYAAQITNERYRQELNCLESFTFFEVNRNEDDVSATKVRESLVLGDTGRFKKYTPVAIHESFDQLRGIYHKVIKESLDETTLGHYMKTKDVIKKYWDGPTIGWHSFVNIFTGIIDGPLEEDVEKQIHDIFISDKTIKKGYDDPVAVEDCLRKYSDSL